MATEVAMPGTNTSEFELPPRKKPKVSELPLSSAQRASIDGMLHTFKKKGEFDALRKKAFQQYNESAQRGKFEAALRTFTTNEIERDPIKYMKPDRRMGAPLLEGAAARGDVYGQTEKDVDAYIDQYLASAERALREIRRKEIGDTAADDELERGNKSDEAYAAEAEGRRRDRAKKHVEEEKVRRKQEVSEKKKKELMALRKKQEELTQETERLQREQKRRAERDAWKAAEKDKERERIRKYNEERDKAKKEAEDREQAAKEERDRRQKERDTREQKRLEEEALDLLLREGKAMAEKARRPELERSESMEPPPRLTKHTLATRNSMSRDEMRAQGLMPTSMTLKKGDKPNVPTEPRGSATQTPATEGDRRRPSRARSPSPARSSYSRRREPSPRGDDRRPSRRETGQRDTLYRDISAERSAWKARLREPSRGEEGEVVERAPARARSRSRDSYRRRRDSRSPPRRRPRDDSRSRSPPRFRDREASPARRRDRDASPLRRRERSPAHSGIDRWVPGGAGGGAGGGATSVRRRDDDDRDRRGSRRADDDDRDRRRRDEDERDADRRRRDTIDRYVPGGSARVDEPKRRERSRSRERDRERYRERSRDRDREREREGERDHDRKGSKSD
ncbi:hypothetical protein LTR08_000218 [Meristemomyces frigidus]|nr:hypothetical protein LTR08_000218 [Meristemomyces frigidus]